MSFTYGETNDNGEIKRIISDTELKELNDSITDAYVNHGIYIIAAAGNNNRGDFAVNTFPSSHPLVTTVSALRKTIDGEYEFQETFSRGSEVDVSAPGVNIYKQTILPKVNDNSTVYNYGDGTSLAAPFVTGTVALAKEKFPKYTNDDIYALLMINAKQIEQRALWNEKTGYGLVQANFKKQLNKTDNKVYIEENQTGYFVPKRYEENGLLSSVNSKTTVVSSSTYNSGTMYDSSEGRWYQINNGEPRLAWVLLGKPLLKAGHNKIIYDEIFYSQELIDGKESASNYASFSSGKRILFRFENQVKVSGIDVKFAEDIVQNFSLTLYDENQNVLLSQSFDREGVYSFEKIENVEYVELKNQNGSTIKISEFELLGDYYGAYKSHVKDVNLSFNSRTDERILYEGPTDIFPEEEQNTETKSNLMNATFKADKAYDWDDTIKNFKWYRISNDELGIENKWVELDKNEHSFIFNNDLTDTLFGQFTKKQSASYEYELFDNKVNYITLSSKGFLDYEFDIPVDINGMYIENKPNTINNSLTVTFTDNAREERKHILTDDDLFDRYLLFEEKYENIRKIRIENNHSSQKADITEMAFFGTETSFANHYLPPYVKSVALPKGTLLVSDNPYKPNYDMIALENDYATYTSRGFGLRPVEGMYEWLEIQLPSGDKRWIQQSVYLTNDRISANGIFDTFQAEITNSKNVSWDYELHDNKIGNYAQLKQNGEVTYQWSTPVSIQSMYLKLNKYVDEVNANIKVQLLDANQEVISVKFLNRADFYHQYFQWHEPVDNVTSMRIVNIGESLAINEIELFQ